MCGGTIFIMVVLEKMISVLNLGIECHNSSYHKVEVNFFFFGILWCGLYGFTSQGYSDPCVIQILVIFNLFLFFSSF